MNFLKQKTLKNIHIHKLIYPIDIYVFLKFLGFFGRETGKLELLCRFESPHHMMEHHPKLNLIVLVLLMTVCWVQGSSRIEEYIALQLGQNITGKVTDIYIDNPMSCIRR